MVTPMSSSVQLKLHDGTCKADETEYRKLVWSLQYLTLTRPDIAFCVNRLSQFMHSPSQSHWSSLKRILTYLKGTIHYGLSL